MKVVAYITDLGLQASVATSVREAGAELAIFTSLYKFIPVLPSRPTLIVIDLEAQGISGPALVSQVKNFDSSIPVIACASEGREDLLAKGKRSGADQVLSHARFREELSSILESANGD